MAVACGHVGAAPVSDQAGQGQAAADFQNMLQRIDRSERNPLGQARTRGPQQAKEWPGGRRNAKMQGHAQGVVKLLFVQQRADDQVIDTVNVEILLLGLVAKFAGDSRWGNGSEQKSSRVSARALECSDCTL